jgi:hypothetical protein
MNTGPDLPDSKLTPEERALAERIARAMPQREPSAALDARILEAARDAVAPAAVATPILRIQPRTRRRWPAIVGIAATLVLAVGIGWQLRPHDDRQAAYSEIPKAAPVASAPRGGGPQADVDAYQAMPRDDAEARAQKEVEPDAAMTAPAPPAQVASQPVATPAPPPPPPLPPPPPPEEPPVIVDAPEPMQAPAEATYPAITLEQASPPPAPSPAPAWAADTPEAGLSGGDTATSALMAPAPAPAKAMRFNKAAAPVEAESNALGNIDSRTLDKIEVTGGLHIDEDDQPLDAEPPASADSPQVQQAWLKRVRALLDEDRRDDARDSLREYQRRYPEATLPDDLRLLLEE